MPHFNPPLPTCFPSLLLYTGVNINNKGNNNTIKNNKDGLNWVVPFIYL